MFLPVNRFSNPPSVPFGRILSNLIEGIPLTGISGFPTILYTVCRRKPPLPSASSPTSSLRQRVSPPAPPVGEARRV